MHNHDDEGHVNGIAVPSTGATEEELDAYEQRLTSEAVIDQVKVPPNSTHCSPKTFFAAQEIRVALYHEFEG
jgi:hypothetical protein